MTIHKPITTENNRDLDHILAYSNFGRTKNLSLILFLANFILLYTDYLHSVNGSWTLGYRLLYQSHLVLGIVSGLFYIISFIITPKDPMEIKWVHRFYEILYSFFILSLGAVISGSIDQHIHSQITVYTMACFAVAVVYYHKPKLTLLLYTLPHILFLKLITLNQLNPTIREGHLGNGSLLVVIALFIAITLNKMKQRDVLYQTSLEALVNERTRDLQKYNDLLKQEIAERQRAELELDRFFAASPDILCILDFKGYIKRSNPALRQILGYSQAELASTAISKLIHPEDVSLTCAEVKRALNQKQAILKVELRCRNKSGEYKWLEWLAVFVPEGQEVFAVGRDVTDRKQSYAKVCRLASIVESSNDGIISMTREGYVLDWNPAAQRICGYLEGETLGKHISRLMSPAKYQELNAILRKVTTGEQVSLFETKWHSNDGSTVDVALSVFPIGDFAEGISGYSIIFIELTEKKRLEAELARLDRLNVVGEMAACICHEVRNPMTTIKGFLQLTRGKQNAKGQEYFDIMIEELDRANTILSEFLSISRNKVTMFEQRNIKEIIRALLPLLQAEALTSDKLIQVDLQDVPDLQLDEMEIRQLVLNLVRNGLEAMPREGILRIQTFFTEGEVALTVTDQGSGIPPEVLAKLGTPFFSTKKDGTGLGLAVCESIIARHKGRLEVKSGTDGSTFYVYLNPKLCRNLGIA